MKNEKFCFSKGTGLIALIGIVLVGVVLAMQMVGNQSTSTSTRASGVTYNPIVQWNCKTGPGAVTGATQNLDYYHDKVTGKNYKSQKGTGRYVGSVQVYMGLYEIPAIGNYCKGVAGRCNDVTFEAGGCTQSLYQLGAYNASNPFYANSSCQGRILRTPTEGVYATYDNLTTYTNTIGGKNVGPFCGDKTRAKNAVNSAAYRMAIPMEFDCPQYDKENRSGGDNPDSGLVIFYYQNGRYYSDARLTPDSDVTDLGVGNFCKSARAAKGTAITGITQVNCGTFGGSAKKYVTRIGSQYFFDAKATLQASDDQIKGFCKNPNDVKYYTGGSNEWDSLLYVKVSCDRFTPGGLGTSTLYYQGGNYFLDGAGTTQIAERFAPNVCTGIPSTYTCKSWYSNAGITIPAKNEGIVFTTVDGLKFTPANATSVKLDAIKLQNLCTK